MADNEAGGEDALVGNVNKLMVTPPGYTGLPKKGHIIFDACFESGERSEYLYFYPPFHAVMLNTTVQEQHLFEIKMCCDSINLFSVTFDQFNASLLNKNK